MINLALVLFENMNVTFMDITKCSFCVPSFSNKKMPCQVKKSSLRLFIRVGMLSCYF